ncbi:MAG: ATP12 family chaperone protein [Hyphomicrobium sp.]
MSDHNESGAKPVKVPGKEAATAPLPKRFYANVTVESAARKAGFAILLDGRPIRTPKKMLLIVPTRALAGAIAAEWAAQSERVDPQTMSLSKLAITAIDGVRGGAADVAADIVTFAGSDLLCYRAEGPEALVQRQAEVWDALLQWCEAEFGARFIRAEGVIPVEQSREVLDRIAGEVALFDALALTCLHVMSTLTGSALLALAHAKGRLSVEEAWAAAHIDEDRQISQWGEDAESAGRRAARWAEMQAASRFLSLLRQA